MADAKGIEQEAAQLLLCYTFFYHDQRMWHRFFKWPGLIASLFTSGGAAGIAIGNSTSKALEYIVLFTAALSLLASSITALYGHETLMEKSKASQADFNALQSGAKREIGRIQRAAGIHTEKKLQELDTALDVLQAKLSKAKQDAPFIDPAKKHEWMAKPVPGKPLDCDSFAVSIPPTYKGLEDAAARCRRQDCTQGRMKTAPPAHGSAALAAAQAHVPPAPATRSPPSAGPATQMAVSMVPAILTSGASQLSKVGAQLVEEALLSNEAAQILSQLSLLPADAYATATIKLS